MRGTLLNTVAVLDAQIAEIISHYFCNVEHRRALFMSDIATAQFFSLRMKEAVLKKIVKLECGFYLERNPGLFKEFEAIRNFRNDLAHAIIDVSEEALIRGPTESIGFVSFKDGKEHTRRVTPAEADSYNARAGMLLGNLKEIALILGTPARYA